MPLRIVDLGSRISSNQHRTHRELFDHDDHEYIGVDVLDGPNVDVVMTKPYSIPVRSNSADLVISGQTFEHIPFMWASILEITRVLKPGGHAFITAPSRGHIHNVQDCWRFYPDGMRALAAWSRLELREAFTDFPPRVTHAVSSTTRRSLRNRIGATPSACSASLPTTRGCAWRSSAGSRRPGRTASVGSREHRCRHRFRATRWARRAGRGGDH